MFVSELNSCIRLFIFSLIYYCFCYLMVKPADVQLALLFTITSSPAAIFSSTLHPSLFYQVLFLCFLFLCSVTLPVHRFILDFCDKVLALHPDSDFRTFGSCYDILPLTMTIHTFLLKFRRFRVSFLLLNSSLTACNVGD